MALRAPDFGNRWTTDLGRIIHRNLAGFPKFYKRAIQPVIDGFEITVSLASKVDMEAFISALISAAGTTVSYTDFEGTVWSGFWEPDSLKIRRGRYRAWCGTGSAGVCVDCDYQIEVRFKGQRS